MPPSSGKQSFLKNTLFAGLTSLSDILFLLLLIISGRYLGAEEFGVFNTALAISALLMFGTNLGLDSLAIRKISLDKTAASIIFGDLLLWKLLISIIVISIQFGAIYLITDNTKILDIVFILCFAALMRSFNISCRSILQSHERFDLESFIVLFERICIFLIGITVLFWGWGIQALAYTFLLVRFTALLIYFIVIRKHITRPAYRPIGRHSFTFQKEALPFGMAIIIYGLFTQIDILLLSYFKSDYETGIFSAAYKIYEGFLIVTIVLSSVVYPRLSNFSENDLDRFHYYTNQTIKFLIWSGFTIITALMLYSDIVIDLFFGSEFKSSADLLRILSISILFAFFGSFMFTIFRSVGQQSYILKVMLLCLSVKSLINIIFIPQYSVYGASIGVIGGTFTMCVASYLVLNRTGYLKAEITRIVIKSALIFSVIYLICLNLTDLPYVSIPVFAALSVILSLIFRITGLTELRALFSAK